MEKGGGGGGCGEEREGGFCSVKILAGHGQAAAADGIEAQERRAAAGLVPTQTTQEAGWARSSAEQIMQR